MKLLGTFQVKTYLSQLLKELESLKFLKKKVLYLD